MADNTNSSEMPGMGFLSHLIELRDRLLKIVLVIGIIFIILVPFAKDLYALFAAPLVANLPEGQNMLSINPAGPFLVPFKLALLAAFLIALPFLFYQLWSFVAPGLYKHEKKLIIPLLTSSVALFYTGIAFAYFVLLPMMFSVIQAFTPEGVSATPDIGSYLDFVMMIFIAFGFGFEMPIATILVISTGMTTAKKLGRKRPYVVVGAFIVGMLLTPPDVISQVMLAIPMWLLFELGLFMSRFFNKRVEDAGLAREKMDQEDRNKADLLAAGSSVAASESATYESATKGESLWEDEKYTYEEDDDVNLDDEEDDYKPLTDEEMEAELDRIEAEEQAEEDENDEEKDKK
jgi:sec-independent protein translocase protein TatC